MLFNELGHGWPLHDCEAAETKAGLARAKAILEDGRREEAGRHRPFAHLDELIDVENLSPSETEQLKEIERQAARPATLRPEHLIKHMDPVADEEEHFFIGVLRERVEGTAKIKKAYEAIGDFGLQFLGLPAPSRAVQITVIDASEEPNESYTAIAERGLLEKACIPGALVGISLIGRIGFGHCLWLVTDLQVL